VAASRRWRRTFGQVHYLPQQHRRILTRPEREFYLYVPVCKRGGAERRSHTTESRSVESVCVSGVEGRSLSIPLRAGSTGKHTYPAAMTPAMTPCAACYAPQHTPKHMSRNRLHRHTFDTGGQARTFQPTAHSLRPPLLEAGGTPVRASSRLLSAIAYAVLFLSVSSRPCRGCARETLRICEVRTDGGCVPETEKNKCIYK
jgi:hypothetical protein